mgnify:CR=1 FL=1
MTKTKKKDSQGFPLTEDWAKDYKGGAVVVHGHVVHEQPRQENNVIAVDTGCVFGGELTATVEAAGHMSITIPPRTGMIFVLEEDESN